ncbi:MAG: AAA-like domain-containing protein [Cyanobacteriota bacterium]
MNWEQTRELIEEAVFNYFGESLKDVQWTLLEDVWRGLNYQQISQKNHLSVNYIRGDLAPKLWQKLSLALGRPITKSNFKQIVSNLNANFPVSETLNAPPLDPAPTDYPPLNGYLAADSPHYQERVEPLARKILAQPGAFLALQAPQGMGKTHCLQRLTHWAKSQEYQTAYLHFWQAKSDALENWPLFLESLGIQLANFLNIQTVYSPGAGRYLFNSEDDFNQFLEYRILPRLTQPFLWVLDDVDSLFAFPKIASRFAILLNHWHEKSCFFPHWQVLRLLLAYSPESPQFWMLDHALFSGAVTLELDDFAITQVETLIQKSCIILTPEQRRKLMTLVGGHPYLLSQALYALKYRRQSPDAFFNQASTLGSVYASHLYAKARQLQGVPGLLPLWRQLVWSNRPVAANSLDFRALTYLGLIQWQGNEVMIKNDLYRRFFRQIDQELAP